MSRRSSGFESTPARTACNTYLAAKHIPYVAAEPSPGGYCPSNQFVDGLTPNQRFTPILQHLKAQGVGRVYFVGDDYSSAKVTADGLAQALPSIGATIVGTGYEPFGTTDWSGDLDKARAAKPDAIVVVLVGNDEVSFWKAVAADARLVMLIRIDPNMPGAVVKATGRSVTGVLAVSSYFPTLTSAANSLYKTTLSQQFGDKASPDQFGVQAWDAVFLPAKAMKRAASTDGQKLVQALMNTSIEGPRGAVGCTPDSKGFVTATAYLESARPDGSFKRELSVPDIEPKVNC
jgi:urea transport system substrate-binding protein